ncbi:uncharacterized protein QC763_508010 [Podospora pseudopauciseta]|uniref:Rhodopsin domain-containing protein n=2 Tax=Podospora TaxID=5144 RepID=A0ABR0H9V8_9PEZI|nr:hypothetical protein QC763_508010 [Podospora pseudopauciseta]KAK4675981.1 hypothetical protein QC764_508010 [Podospora pseudoanserina]
MAMQLPTVNGVPVIMPPPEGYVVDFENPARNSVTEAYWLFGVGNFLALLFMMQHLYTKAFIRRRFQIEDASLIIAWGCSIALQSMIVRDFMRGIMGTHSWEMPVTKFLLFLRALYLLPILYNPVQCGAKLALLLLYRRLAPQLWYQITVYVVMFIVVGSSFAIMFAAIFPCNPVQSAWDISIPGECINRPALYQATAILGAITDLMVLAVPIPIVVKLHVPLKHKIALIAAFSVGGITSFTSIMRLHALIVSMGDIDQSWGGGPVLLWIFAEANLSVICGTLPTIKPFLNHFVPRLLGSSNARSAYPVNSGLSKSGGPPTFGGGGGGNQSQSQKRDKYQRFDDDIMYPLETVVAIETGDDYASSEPIRKSESGSEKAINPGGIVQTKTATITYQNAHAR